MAKRKRSTKKEVPVGKQTSHSYQKQAYAIALGHRIAVGKESGPAPIVYDIDWNPKPSMCRRKDVAAMLACVSDFGTYIYYFSKSIEKWKTMVIHHWPSRKGSCLKWHPSGTSLVSASDADPEDPNKPAKISLLAYDSSRSDFSAQSVKFPEGLKACSLIWVVDGVLIVAVWPCSKIFFFHADKTSTKLTRVGTPADIGFPLKATISLQAHPKGLFFFACAPETESILVWGKGGGPLTTLRWQRLCSVKCEPGLYTMTFGKTREELIAIEKGYRHSWLFNEGAPEYLQFMFKSENEHGVLKKVRNKLNSGIISVAASKPGNLVASGGWGDTLIIHHKQKEISGVNSGWKLVASRREVCYNSFLYGGVKCVKFNPKEDISMRLATAGSGFIHLWAVYPRGSSTLSLPWPKRRFEPDYYTHGLKSNSIDVPDSDLDLDDSGISWEDVLERNEEVVIEYEELSEDEAEEDEDEAEEDEGEAEVEQRASLIERFNDVSANAESILELIETGDDVPTERVKSLCVSILNDKDEINSAIKKDP